MVAYLLSGSQLGDFQAQKVFFFIENFQRRRDELFLLSQCSSSAHQVLRTVLHYVQSLLHERVDLFLRDIAIAHIFQTRNYTTAIAYI